MTKQIINIGTSANKGNGDPLRTAFTKVNENFTELYTALGLNVDGTLNLGAFEFTGSVMSTTDSTAITIDQATTVTSNLTVGGDILPSLANGGNLGSSAAPWRSLYVSNNTIYLGGIPLSLDANNNLTVNGLPVTGGGASVTTSATAPVEPSIGDLWYDTNSGRTYVYYDASWVDSSPVDGAGISSTNQLVNGTNTVSLGSDGELTLPGGRTRIGTLLGTDAIIANEDTAFGVVAQGTNGAVQLVWIEDLENAYTSNLAAVYVNSGGPGSVRIATGANGSPGPKFWEFKNSGALTFPQGTTIATADGTDAFIIDGAVDKDIQIYTYSGETARGWTFGTDGSLQIPGDIKSNGNINIEINLEDSTLRRWQFGEDGLLTFPNGTNQSTAWTGSVSSLVNSARTVSLGSDGTLTLPAQSATLTNVNQIVSAKIYRAGASTDTGTIQTALDNWMGAEQTWIDLRDQDAQINAGQNARPWAGMPSYTAYQQIMLFNPTGGQLPPPGNMAPTAKTASDAYLTYKELLHNIDIVAGNYKFSFENTGALRVPGVITKNNNLTLVSVGTTVYQQLSDQGLPVEVRNDLTASVVADGENGRVFIRTDDGTTLRTWQFDVNGGLTFPNGALKIAGNKISNYVTTEFGASGSQLDVAQTKTVITNGVTNSLGSGPSLTGQSLFEVSTNGILSSFQVINTLDDTSLTSEFLTELDNLSFKIGQRVTNDLGDGSEPLVAFSGWTFSTDAPGYTKTLTLPNGAVINETASSPGLLKKKYSGTFVLDPTWFAANAGNLIETSTVSTIQSTDLEVFNAFSFEFTGYFVPPTSANYTFKAHADETFVFWIGAKALSGYTYANKDMYGDYNGTYPEQQTQSFTIALTAGQFYPIRIQWGNSAGWGVLDVFTWANDAGQADTADFTGHIYTADTGTAKISVNDNKSIILSTNNDTLNNWTFAADGSVTLPNAAVIRQSTNADVTTQFTYYTEAIADWEYTRINDYLYAINSDPNDFRTLEGWPFAGWDDVDGTTAPAYLAIVNNAQTIQNLAPSSPPTPLVFTPAISAAMFVQLRTQLTQVINTYADWQALLPSVDIVAGSEKLSLLTNNKIQVPGIIQTDPEEDLVIRTRYAGVTSPPAGSGQLSYNNRDFIFGTNGSITFPNNTVQTTAYAPFTGSWTIPVGANTVSFTVPPNGAYHMWVRGNIPNGIISYVATVHVTNPNVPVIGSQRAYNYTDGGSPILLTSLPTQFIGTEGTIATGGVVGTANNRFDFGISNTSGTSQVIYYGYTKI